jgi:hypothetical protein
MVMMNGTKKQVTAPQILLISCLPGTLPGYATLKPWVFLMLGSCNLEAKEVGKDYIILT